MDPYAGFEPQVGEIRALRSFRIGPGGGLHPLFSDQPWREGTNTAVCRRERETVVWHAAPDPDCTCGFYAYGSERATGEYPHSRHVLAVVACWGRVIAGTRGLRAEKCRVEALWLSTAVPEHLVDVVRERYPAVAIYRERAAMLAEHPPTALDCYDSVADQRRFRSGRWLSVAAVAAALAGVLPTAWLGGQSTAALVWGSLGALFLVLGLTRGWRGRDVAAYRQRLLSLAVVLWMLAPFAGLPGLFLLRLPLLELAMFLALQRFQLRRSAARFPADIG
jgi:hypothetical protein